MSATSGESRYQRLRLLGRGGTAEVVSVYLPDRKTTAALKHPLSDSPDSLQLFSPLAAREALLIGRERFPGLVRLLEQPDNPATSILLEICNGPTLDLIGRIDNVPVLLNLLSALALDLSFLKARGIIHGDIKPQNFFVPSNWQNFSNHSLFYAKLSDFSLGRFAHEPESARAGAGTVGYMAPETVLENRTSHQSDLFALGVIAYQLATGRHPFMDEDAEPVRVNARVVEENPQPLNEFRNDLTPEFAQLVASLLAKRESDRPRTAHDVCSALETFGAQYPFSKALRPTHLLHATSSFNDAISATVSPKLADDTRLLILAENTRSLLRLILSANWRHGRVQFDGERFSAHSDLIWPSLLRRTTLNGFSQLALSEKRRIIVQSVITSSERDLSGNNQSENPCAQTASALSELLIHLLKPKTIRQVARCRAPQIERAGNLANASRLYIMAGDLANAARCACDTSITLAADHKTESALRVLRRVLSYAELSGELFAVREALMHYGDLLKQIGESEQALRVYRQIVELYKDRSPDKLLAETHKDLGDLHKLRQDFRSGIEALQKALDIYGELGDVAEISHTHNNLGNIHWINSDFVSALHHYRTALRIQRTHRLKPDIAMTLSNIASIYGLQSRFDRCIRLLNMALELMKELGDEGEIARTLNNMGYVEAVSGHPSRSVENVRQALEINQRTGARKEQLYNIDNLSDASLQLGRVKEAIRYLEDGLTVGSELQDIPHLAVFHLTLTGAQLRLGQADSAVRSSMTARSYLDQCVYPPAESIYLLQTARIRYFIGDYDVALSLAVTAAESLARLNDRPACLQALLLATRLTDAPGLYSQAQTIAEALRLDRGKLLLAFNSAERALVHHDVAAAHTTLNNAVEQLDSLEEDIERPRLHALAAEIYIECGETERAAVSLHKANSLASRMGLLPEIATLLTLRARIESDTREYAQCYATSRQALHLIRQMAENIGNDEDRTTFLKRRVVQNLMVEVRRLGAILEQKQRAE